MSQSPRPNSLSQVIILSLLHDGLTPTQAALRFGVSRQWIYQLLARYGGLGSPQLITQKWKSLNLDRQRGILKAILESVQVDKVIQRGMPFNPQRLRPIWKF